MSKKGMTLIELIIVLAVIAVIGAIIANNFTYTTDKARLKSDIQSARVIQNAIELYNAEQKTSITAVTMTGIIETLNKKGYLRISEDDIQCEAAEWEYKSEKATVIVNISKCSDGIKKNAFSQLTTQEAKLVEGGVTDSLEVSHDEGT